MRSNRSRVFGLTWLSYAVYYFGRKSFPVVKATLETSFGIGRPALALIDTAYLATYAVGQFSMGWLGDRIGARRLIAWGMLGSSAVCLAFGFSSAALVFAVLFGLNGLFQATGWSGNVKAMGEAYGPKERGAVMGLWTTCFQVGPLAATAMAAYLLKHSGWRAAFLYPAACVGVVGVAVWLLLPERKREASTVEGRASRAAAASTALKNPIVWLLGLSYFGMKLIRYCIDFWQPYYLERALGYAKDDAAYFSTAFQFGGIFGSIAIGWISDRWFSDRRGAVAMVSTALLALSLLLYSVVGPLGRIEGALALALVGFFLFGPDALISGVAAQDMGGPLATATVAGFINGCGSVGAIAQGLVVVTVSEKFGWGAVFQVLMGLAAFSSVALAAVWRLQRRAGAAAPGSA